MRIIPLDVYNAHPHNYDNPVTRGPALVVVNAVLLFFATVAYTLRIYTRKIIQRSLGWDDLSITVAFVLAVGLSAAVMLANESFYWYALASFGCSFLTALRNRHMWDVPYTLPALAGMPHTGHIGSELTAGQRLGRQRWLQRSSLLEQSPPPALRC
jgi:hypothetical protein